MSVDDRTPGPPLAAADTPTVPRSAYGELVPSSVFSHPAFLPRKPTAVQEIEVLLQDRQRLAEEVVALREAGIRWVA